MSKKTLLSNKEKMDKAKRLKTSNENNSQENQNSASNQSNQLNYVLRRQLKDQIINILNQLTALLYGETIDKDNEKNLIKENQNLIQELVNLRLSKENDLYNHLNQNQLVLDIDDDTRMKIIVNLIKNFNYSISHPNFILDEDKMNLIFENKKRINSLLHWEVRFIKSDTITDLSIGK